MCETIGCRNLQFGVASGAAGDSDKGAGRGDKRRAEQPQQRYGQNQRYSALKSRSVCFQTPRPSGPL
jgi:hypothetical protein